MWRKDVEAHLRVLEHIKADDGFEALVEEIASTLCSAVAKGGKIILFGNGGSAADAQHIAAEFVGRFNFDRAAINAVALTTNPSIVTAIANDFDFSSVFARQVSAIVTDLDVVIGISTSGTSKSVLAGLREAKAAGACTVLLTGSACKEHAADYVVPVPSDDTPRIQEMHILIGHYWAEYVEKMLYKN